MNLPRDFEEYVRKGVVRRISPDVPRAKFLSEEAKNSLEGLKERIKIIGINNKNANSIIKDCYDIIMEMIRAKVLTTGFSASGNYAHEAEVAYTRKLNFSVSEISFLNKLRYYRNSTIYYGKILDEDYARKTVKFLKQILPKLK